LLQVLVFEFFEPGRLFYTLVCYISFSVFIKIEILIMFWKIKLKKIRIKIKKLNSYIKYLNNLQIICGTQRQWAINYVAEVL